MQRNPGLFGKFVQHLGKRSFPIGCPHLCGKLLLDFELCRGHPRSPLSRQPGPTLGKVFPITGFRELNRPYKRHTRRFSVFNDIQQGIALAGGNHLLRVEPADHAALAEQLAGDNAVG